MAGILYLVPSPIGNLEEVSPRCLFVLKFVDYVACEDTRNTSKLLFLLKINKKCISCHEHNENQASEQIIKDLLDGKNVAYLSDAGYPCISDPGSILVKKAIENSIIVTPLSGPNAFLNGLVGSGIDASHFIFYGFLASNPTEKEKELNKLKDLPYTLIFYEAPHRVKETLKIMESVLGNRKICIARELTKIHEEFIRSNLTTINQENPDIIGEMVIVVSKKEESKIQVDATYELALEKAKLLVKSGFSVKEASKIVSLIYDVKKNLIYKKLLDETEEK